jgi:hypothetical protein
MLRDIIEGHINEMLSKNDKMSNERLAICLKCPIVKETSVGLVCDSNKWIDPKTSDVSETPKLNYKRGCACRLNAKTRVESNHCIVNKW